MEKRLQFFLTMFSTSVCGISKFRYVDLVLKAALFQFVFPGHYYLSHGQNSMQESRGRGLVGWQSSAHELLGEKEFSLGKLTGTLGKIIS